MAGASYQGKREWIVFDVTGKSCQAIRLVLGKGAVFPRIVGNRLDDRLVIDGVNRHVKRLAGGSIAVGCLQVIVQAPIFHGDRNGGAAVLIGNGREFQGAR